ncbi:hypothetical protein R8Z50_14245 [Longispora sp. K20-0274]|uniref:hypothetical protein n=1 Tax=Longispora sp. K20-0274 TaxID=3088255 RepID=UPI00399C3FAF
MMAARKLMIGAGLLAAGTAVGAYLALGGGHPAPAPAPRTAAVELAAAEQAAASDKAAEIASRFFVHVDQRADGKPVTAAQDNIDAAAAAKAPQVVGQPVPVYSLNPDFVTQGVTAPVGRLVYLAVETRSATGQQATLQLVKNGDSYDVRGVGDGVEELTYIKAGEGSPVFLEPQRHAYYKVTDGRVLPLNAPAREAVGEGLSLADYQKQVHDRYAGRLNDGKLG